MGFGGALRKTQKNGKPWIPLPQHPGVQLFHADLEHYLAIVERVYVAVQRSGRHKREC